MTWPCARWMSVPSGLQAPTKVYATPPRMYRKELSMTAHTGLSRLSIRQNITSYRSSGVLVLLIVSVLSASGLILKRASASPGAASPKDGPTSPALRGKEAFDQLKQQGLYSSLQEAKTASRYKAEWQTQTGLAGLESAFELKNPAHNLRAYLTSNELRVMSLSVSSTGRQQM